MISAADEVANGTFEIRDSDFISVGRVHSKNAQTDKHAD
jgi:hypothetical protein